MNLRVAIVFVMTEFAFILLTFGMKWFSCKSPCNLDPEVKLRGSVRIGSGPEAGYSCGQLKAQERIRGEKEYLPKLAGNKYFEDSEAELRFQSHLLSSWVELSHSSCCRLWFTNLRTRLGLRILLVSLTDYIAHDGWDPLSLMVFASLMEYPRKKRD